MATSPFSNTYEEKDKRVSSGPSMAPTVQLPPDPAMGMLGSLASAFLGPVGTKLGTAVAGWLPFEGGTTGVPDMKEQAQEMYQAVTDNSARSFRNPAINMNIGGWVTAEDQGRVKPGIVYTQQMPDTTSATPAFNDVNFIQSGEYVIPPQNLNLNQREAHLAALQRRFGQQERDLREAQAGLGVKGSQYSGVLDALHDATQKDVNLINRYGVDGRGSAYNARGFGSKFMPGVDSTTFGAMYPGGSAPGHFTPNPDYMAVDRMYPAPGYRTYIDDMVSNLRGGIEDVQATVFPGEEIIPREAIQNENLKQNAWHNIQRMVDEGREIQGRMMDDNVPVTVFPGEAIVPPAIPRESIQQFRDAIEFRSPMQGVPKTFNYLPTIKGNSLNDIIAHEEFKKNPPYIPIAPLGPQDFKGGTHKVAGIDPQKYSTGAINVKDQDPMFVPDILQPYILNEGPGMDPNSIRFWNLHWKGTLPEIQTPSNPGPYIGPLSDRQMKQQLHEQKMDHNEQLHQKKLLT